MLSFAQGSYKKPPKEIMDVLDAPAIPGTSISPSRDKIALLTPNRYPPIADLAQPMLRLAGTRVNPTTNGPHLQMCIRDRDMTVARIRDLSAKYLDPNRMIWLVVGDAKTQLPRLKELGFGEPILIQK